MSTHTGVTNCQKTVRFFGPRCILYGMFDVAIEMRNRLRELTIAGRMYVCMYLFILKTH